MFKSISWQAFIFFLTACTFLYYVIISLLFYRKEIITGFQKLVSNRIQNQQHENPTYLETLLEKTMLLSDGIREYLQKAVYENTNKQELIEELKTMVHQNAQLNQTPFMVTINKLILKECAKNKNVYLSVEEVDSMWLDAG